MNDSEIARIDACAGKPKSPLLPHGGAKKLMEEGQDYLNAAQRAIADLRRVHDAGESALMDQEKYIDTISSLLVLLDDKMRWAYEALRESPEPKS
jgi:hypothetical protein